MSTASTDALSTLVCYARSSPAPLCSRRSAILVSEGWGSFLRLCQRMTILTTDEVVAAA